MSPTNNTEINSSTYSNEDIDALFKTKTILEPPTEEQWKKLYQSLETTPEQLRESVKTLREWLSHQPHLPQSATDTMLASFLTGCKNSMQRAKQKLDAYYTVRGYIPELCQNRDPLAKEARNATIPVKMYLLPKLDPSTGYRIISTSFKSPDPTFYDVKENLKRIFCLIDIRMLTDQDGFYTGDFMICDAKMFSLGHAVRITPTVMKNFLHCIQDVLPLRVKGILFYNAPPLIEKTMNSVVKPFLKKKIADRFYIYSDDHSILLKHFPKEILPKNLGGDQEVTDDILDKLWDKNLESWRDWLMNEGCQHSDESKRPVDDNENKDGYKSNYFGVEGSFRKLDLD